MVDFELVDKYIIYDLVKRTLERDISKLDILKTGTLLELKYGAALNIARDELKLIKAQMKQADLRLDQEIRVDELIIEYHFLQKGYFQKYRYTFFALRNRTIKEIEKLFRIIDQPTYFD